MRTRTPKEAQIVVVDYRRSLLGEVPDEYLLNYLTSATQATPDAQGPRGLPREPHPRPRRHPRAAAQPLVVEGRRGLRPGRRLRPGRHPAELAGRAAAAAAGAGPRRRPAPGRRPPSGGASPALYEPVIQSLRDLAMPGLLLSGSPDEGALIGNLKPQPLPARPRSPSDPRPRRRGRPDGVDRPGAADSAAVDLAGGWTTPSGRRWAARSGRLRQPGRGGQSTRLGRAEPAARARVDEPASCTTCSAVDDTSSRATLGSDATRGPSRARRPGRPVRDAGTPHLRSSPTPWPGGDGAVVVREVGLGVEFGSRTHLGARRRRRLPVEEAGVITASSGPGATVTGRA